MKWPERHTVDVWELFFCLFIKPFFCNYKSEKKLNKFISQRKTYQYIMKCRTWV